MLVIVIDPDSEGRYVIIELLLNGKKCLVIGLYAPNQQQKQFYKLIHQKLIQLDYKSVIMMGDWNGVIDSRKDKKGSLKASNQAKLPKTFFDLKDDLELRDIWRERHMGESDFTFFSDRHQSFSRIDFFLITNDFISRVKNTKIFPRILSDHSPVWMELFPEDGSRRTWRLNENLFRYEGNLQKCKEYLKEFFLLNMHKGTSMSMVWDASKAYMRGALISMNSAYRRKQMQKCRDLEEEIKLKEKAFISNPLDNKLKVSITMLKEQFNMLMADQIATNLRYMKHNTFCNANKPGRWLAYQLRKKQKSRVIEKIVYKGKEVYQQDLIKKGFLDFYSKL